MAASYLKRSEANRLNAQKSTGPKNATSTRFNAVKHGLLAEGVTEMDDTENFIGLCEQLEAEYAPVGLVEVFLVRRIALCMIRLRRACLIEAEFITADLNPALTTETPEEFLAEMFSTPAGILDPGLPMRLSGIAVEELVTKFQRYETAIESKFYRTLNQLETLQLTRRVAARSTTKTIKAVPTKRKQLASFGNQPQQNER